jgi:hypothetical protein
MFSKAALIIATSLLLNSAIAHSQSAAIDLAPFGYKKVMFGRYVAPASLSYVGDNALFVTLPTDGTLAPYGQPFDYTGIVLSREGNQIGKTQLSGLYEDLLQKRIATQPLSNILVKVGDQLRIYSLDLASFRSIELPPKSQLRIPPDRKSVVVVSQEGNKSMDTIVAIQSVTSRIDHLDFDERAVRDGLLAVSNDGSVAHAIRDSDGELAVHSWSIRWPAFGVGKYQEPFAFVKSDELLVSAMATTPFPPTELYLWKQDGAVLKIGGSKAGFYSNAQPSLDGHRVLLTQTNINNFLVLMGGIDCGPCGESYLYSVVDIPSAKVLFKRKQTWNCSVALAPSGKEVAELCDGVIRFIPVKN